MGKTLHVKSYRLVSPYFAEKKNAIVFGVFSLIVVDILQLIIPRIIKWVVDDLTIRSVTSTKLFHYALSIVGVALFIGVFRFVWRRCLIGTSRRVEEGIRNRLFSHIQTMPSAYFDRTKTGDLMALATNDVQHVRMAIGMGMVALTDAVVLGLAAIGFMLYINVKLTLLSLLPMPLIVVLARISTRRMHRLYKEVQASFADLTEAVRERFAGIRVVKAYCREEVELERLSAISKDYVGKNLRLVRITGCFFPGMMLFSNLSVAIVLYLGGRQAINLTITTGDFVAFISYLGLLTWPMMAMGWVINLIQRGGASLDRINEILKTESQIASPANPRKINNLKGHLVFDKVGYRYGSDKPVILKDLSFSLTKGQTLGVVGPTGSGKTTLCQLIPRLLDPTEGRILIDGIDVREFALDILRTQWAWSRKMLFCFPAPFEKIFVLLRGILLAKKWPWLPELLSCTTRLWRFRSSLIPLLERKELRSRAVRNNAWLWRGLYLCPRHFLFSMIRSAKWIRRRLRPYWKMCKKFLRNARRLWSLIGSVTSKMRT